MMMKSLHVVRAMDQGRVVCEAGSARNRQTMRRCWLLPMCKRLAPSLALWEAIFPLRGKVSWKVCNDQQHLLKGKMGLPASSASWT